MGNVRDYAVITLGYWVFTLTDGALRMLVLLYLHQRGYTALTLASLFLLYEAAGMVTNLVGGWLGARFGLKHTLSSGLLLQALALGLLCVDPELLTVAWVMTVQGLSGIAKDLTKTSAKSYIKKLLPREGGGTAFAPGVYGLLYGMGAGPREGLHACLLGSAVFVVAAVLGTLVLRGIEHRAHVRG